MTTNDQIDEASGQYLADAVGQAVPVGYLCPPGYKQMEVGVIPEDWDVYTISEAFEICNNLRLPISSKVRENIIGEYPYYGPTKIQGFINEFRVEGEYVLTPVEN